MKLCKTCNRTFTDQNLIFCIEDGTPLVEVEDAADEVTVVSPNLSQGAGSAEQNEAYVPRDWQRDYQPPGSFEPPGQRRRVWPWVTGIVVALVIGLVGLGFAFAYLMPKVFRSAINSNNSNVERTERPAANDNSNAVVPNNNSNDSIDNSNAGSDELSPAPTDSAQVLADLTSLEHEWTVANINADKRKLDRILADDYVGTATDGKSQGKAEYIRTIERDTTIEKWDFEDLKVMLRGERATLSGKIRLRIGGQSQEAVFSFIDKFVWRDGRWQAVSSEVARQE